MELYTRFKLPISFAVRKVKMKNFRSLKWTLMLQTLEGVDSFDTAVSYLSSVHMVAPCYLAVGGVKAGEGAIITRDRWASADVWRIKPEKGRWFMLETNFDHWKPTGDSRR